MTRGHHSNSPPSTPPPGGGEGPQSIPPTAAGHPFPLSDAPNALRPQFGVIRNGAATCHTDCATIIPLTSEAKRQRAEWPVERLRRLKELFDEGLSYALIAKAMDTTRSAVSGKNDRLGWTRSSWGSTSLRKQAAPRPEKVRKPASPPRTAFSGMALKVGGNRADAGLRKFSWED